MARIPQGLFRMTVGTVLKQAREQAGLSAEQISERTKIQLYKIEALEEDDYSRLPEGIYLDGILRAYSREVGINSEAMVARARIERGKRPGDWEVPFSAPIDLRGTSRPNDRHRIDVPDSDDQLGSFVTERQTAETPAAPHEPQIVEHSTWANQPIIAPVPAGAAGSGNRANANCPSTSPARAVRPRAARSFRSGLFGCVSTNRIGRSTGMKERHSTPRHATEVEIAAPKTETALPANANDAAPSAASREAAVPARHPETRAVAGSLR